MNGIAIGNRARWWVAAASLAVVAGASGALPAGSDDRAGVPRQDDPSRDGWQTEVFQGEAKSRLKELAHFLEHPTDATAEAAEAVAASGFASSGLRPADLSEAFTSGPITVYRATGQATSRGPRLRGPRGLIESLRELIDPLGDVTEARVGLKIIGVELEPTAAATRQILSFSGRGGGGRFEQHTTLLARWSLSAGSEPPLLTALETLGDFEEVRYRDPGGRPWFSDRTAGALAHNAAFGQQLMRGTWSWLGEIEASLGADIIGHSGLAIGDVDGDGLEDLYACQPGGLPNRLFLRTPDGTANDRSAWAGVDWLDRSHSALLIDFDNDGDKDLALGTAPALILMANDGSGRFSPRAAFGDVTYAYSLAAADYDLDGDLDLYATRYSPLADEPGAVVDVPSPVPYHDAENGAANYLLRNDGDWRFTDATHETGMSADNSRWSFAASWEDFDNDGDPDLYVANDFGRNVLYRNDGAKGGRPRFVNVAAELGVEDTASGMSAAWGDVDHDGRMDLYVGNMFSSAGHRIAFQSRFQPGMSAEDRTAVQRLARGNSLFVARDDGRFDDASLGAGVTLGRWAWGSIFADLDNDGWEDLVVANGYLTAPVADDL